MSMQSAGRNFSAVGYLISSYIGQIELATLVGNCSQAATLSLSVSLLVGQPASASVREGAGKRRLLVFACESSLLLRLLDFVYKQVDTRASCQASERARQRNIFKVCRLASGLEKFQLLCKIQDLKQATFRERTPPPIGELSFFPSLWPTNSNFADL